MLYANYYQLADNMSTLDKLKRCMELSLYKTLATKHGSTVKKIVEKHGATTEVQGKEYKILQVIGRTELVKRLLADVCELCGSTEDVEVHHMRAMKDLHEYPGREKPPWVRRMIAMKRKTMPVCRTCHEDIHAGRPLRRQPLALKEVKALQKVKTLILESRVH
jgi:AI2M/AI1M-like, HNH endonuclease/Type II intron maturase